MPESTLPRIGYVWADLLSLQVELTLPVELPCYYGEMGWHAARSVVDLGTGNGYYLRRLQERFPDKRYLGIDIEPSLIDAARESHGNDPDGLSFQVADIFDFRGSFSAIVCRLVAQHLRRPEALAETAASLLAPGGVMFSVEPNDHRRAFWPRMPGTERLFREFFQKQADAGLDRDAGGKLLPMFEARGLETQRHETVLVPSTLPGYRGLFVRFHELLFDLFERNYGIEADYEELRRELAGWHADERSYAQLGIYVSVFRKVR